MKQGSIEHNGTFLFQAETNATSVELWATDGTPSGTMLVKDIYATGGSGPRNFIVEDEVYFTAYDNGHEIWKTDGTTAGTVTVTTAASGIGIAQDWTEYNGSYYTSMTFTWNGTEVGKFDVNASSVSLLVDLTPGARFSVPYHSKPTDFTVHDGWLWFLCHGCLYRSNGTAAGTTSFVCDAGKDLVLFEDELYFGRSANNKGWELWKTDGTTSGTSMVVDTWVGSNDGFEGKLTPIDDLLYFEAKTVHRMLIMAFG